MLTPRGLGNRFNCTSISTFNDIVPVGFQAPILRKIEITATVIPGVTEYHVENLGPATSATVTPGSSTYLVTGFIDVLDPVAVGTFLAQTSNKVNGLPGSSNCLPWSVSGNLNTIVAPTLAIFDGCYDYNDPLQMPVNGICTTPLSHGGPCTPGPGDVFVGGCCVNTETLGGTRTLYGRLVPPLSPSSCGTPALPASGLRDRRIFDSGDSYQKTMCFSDVAHLNYFRRSLAGADKVVIPLSTSALQFFPGWNSTFIDQGGQVNIGVRIDIKYFYCPAAPVCQPDTGDVCKTVGAMTAINVLANDSAPLGGLNCAALVTPQNLTRGTYGTVQWVNDPACVNALCNLRCVKYTLTTLPPVGVTTDTFTYTIVAANGCTTTCPVTVRICSPVCAPDTGVVCNTNGAMALVNVLGNDSNPCTPGFNCPTLTGANGLTNGTYGSVLWVTDASFTNGLCNLRGVKYTRNATPLPAGVFTDTFNYTISNLNGCTAVCPVTITICAPACQPDTGRVCRSISSTTLVNVLANDTDNCAVNCAALTGSANLTQGTFGSVVWATDPTLPNSLCNQKGVRYTLTSLPPVGTTTDTFTYSFTDSNGCSSTCLVTVTICSPACLADTGTVCRTLGAPSSATLINVLANDTANCTPVNCAALTGSAGLTQGTYGSAAWVTDATLTNALCNQRGVRYTLTSLPPAGTFTDSFNYTFTDANGCPATCPVTVTICAPTCLPDTGQACNSVGFMTFVNVLGNDSDNCAVNCGALTGTSGLTQGTYGSAVWATDASFTNALCNTKGIKYTVTSLPPVGTTTDTFNYTFTDSNGCSATCAVTITICSPKCQPDTGDACRTVGGMALVNVLANDATCRPINCGSLTGTSGLSQGTYGTVAWATDATFTNGLCNTKGIKYTLNTLPPTTCATDTFSYTITDTLGCTSTCSVTITIAAPTCVADCADVCGSVGSMTTINVLGNDTSCRPLNCGLLTGTTGLTQGTYGRVTWVSDGGCTNALCNGKCVRYTLQSVPPAGVTMDTFSYTITDSFGCTSTCTVQVKICRVDAVDDTIMGCGNLPLRICILDNDISTCGTLNCSNLSIVTQPPNGNVQVVQNCANLPTDCCHTPLAGCTGCCIVYTPNTGFSGIETFTYRISTTSTGCPGGTPITCTDTATVTITIKPAPIAADDMYELENGMAGPFNVTLNDSPGTGCDTAGCGAPCAFIGCPVITQQPQFGTLMILPDCTIKYTANPGVPFPGADSFRYCVRNNCDCCDDALVTITECPMIDRRQPGSLLIYPEFDNRPGRATYVTITNASCKWPNAGTWVEFIYIDKTNCIETNRTTFLTPCDTYTVLTSAHNPNQVRGYMYAFAKDALGHPISFNHLIGDLLILDGVDGYQYAVNPVSFRSPVPRGAFTDLDNDGIRDLNGLEYDPAPDRLLIPRFLGQDPPGEGGLVQDELVVLNLSGGLSFQTVLSFIGYNDNEIPFSVTKQFYCWEKWKLLEISNAFSNAYLKELGDDRLEIIGMTTRESGWLRIDGLSAFSDAETIVDPAFYAFLVERQITSDRGAELPFELCTQGNGDLLPKNPLGDGPIPVVGDNQ